MRTLGNNVHIISSFEKNCIMQFEINNNINANSTISESSKKKTLSLVFELLDVSTAVQKRLLVC